MKAFVCQNKVGWSEGKGSRNRLSGGNACGRTALKKARDERAKSAENDEEHKGRIASAEKHSVEIKL